MKTKNTKPCAHTGCGLPAKVKFLCPKHYASLERETAIQRGYTWHCLHPEYQKSWRDQNREKSRNYQKTPRAKARRNLKKNLYSRFRDQKQRPTWSQANAILDFYVKCPPGHVVDHIVPLRGKIVSGLHVLENLQYLPQHVNSSKSARFDFEQYYEEYLASVYQHTQQTIAS